MAVQTADVQRQSIGVSPNRMVALPLAGYTNFDAGSLVNTVYKGSVVICDVSDTAGYFRAAPLSSSVNSASGDVFGGIAEEYMSTGTSITADGGKSVKVARDGIHAFLKGGLAQTDVGKQIYASDDQSVTTTSTNNWWIGHLVAVDATYAWIDIGRAAGMLNSAT